MTDIVARLTEAACAAIATELMVKRDGTVHEGVAFVERRTTGPALLAVVTKKAGGA
jgi:hypothetical protein